MYRLFLFVFDFVSKKTNPVSAKTYFLHCSACNETLLLDETCSNQSKESKPTRVTRGHVTNVVFVFLQIRIKHLFFLLLLLLNNNFTPTFKCMLFLAQFSSFSNLIYIHQFRINVLPHSIVSAEIYVDNIHQK